MRLIAASLVTLVVASTSGCNGGGLYAACNGPSDCAEGLRCIDLGGDQRLCTRPCSVEKSRAGYPEGLEDEELLADGAGGQASVKEPQCGDAKIDVTSQDNPDQGAQNVAIESAGVVGVCTVATALLEDDAISGDSVLPGFCTPL